MTWKICTQRCMQRFERILKQMQKQTATKHRSQSSSIRRSTQQHKGGITFSTRFFSAGQNTGLKVPAFEEAHSSTKEGSRSQQDSFPPDKTQVSKFQHSKKHTAAQRRDHVLNKILFRRTK